MVKPLNRHSYLATFGRDIGQQSWGTNLKLKCTCVTGRRDSGEPRRAPDPDDLPRAVGVLAGKGNTGITLIAFILEKS